MKLITLARNLNRIESYLNKQEAVLSAQIPEWFKKMTKEEQKAYLKEHPGSKLKPGGQSKKPEGQSKYHKQKSLKKTAKKKLTVHDLANKMYQLAEKYERKNKGLMEELEEDNDRDSIKMLKDDVRDLKKLGDLIKNKKFRAARNFVDNLDTAIREEVPYTILKAIDSDWA